MPVDHEAEREGGQLPAGKLSAPWLRLEVGVPDGDRTLATLEPDHEMYGLFAWALEQQDTWPLGVHADFWRWAIHQWPRARGGSRATVEMLDNAFHAARRKGLTPEQAAELLGYEFSSLERMRRRRRRPPIPTGEPILSDYVLPRIYVNGGPAPNPGAYSNLRPHELSAVLAVDDPRVRRLEAALAAIERPC